MRAAAQQLTASGVASKTWQDLRVEGKLLVSTITGAIDAAGTTIAELSSLNSNVLFEAGYALGSGKHLWLALDETDTNALKNWKNLGILATVGRLDYSARADPIVTAFLQRVREETEPELLSELLLNARAKEAHAIFAPSVPTKSQASVILEKFLARQSHLKILGAEDDLALAPLDFYVKEIYRSSAAIFHLLAPTRLRSLEHNARASFLAGVAYGLKLPTLMVAEEGFETPLDYKDLLYVYNSTAALQSQVSAWLDNLPTQEGRRLGRMVLEIELPIKTFGQYVAEYERVELSNYFVNTSEFTAILDGTAKVFVGRKGTGKTATMGQAVDELRKDRRQLVVAVKPASYELAQLVELIRSIESDSHSEYLMLSLWRYLLSTEIAIQALAYAAELPAGAGGNAALQELQQEVSSLGIDADEDLSLRLEGAVSRLVDEPRRAGESEQAFIGRVLGLQKLGRLRDLVIAALRDFSRVAVLIDNLDKAWEKGADYEVLARFVLSLLSAIGKVEREFSRPARGIDSVNVTLTVFLRTDIFDAIARFAREPDKVGVLAVRWQDQELLARVLEERYAANRSKKEPNRSFSMWEEVFASEVRGIPTRDYMLWRTLPRPRDFIYLANASLTTAINRRHATITADDITTAERQYSRFAIEALLVESEVEGFDLEEALYEFAGVDSTITKTELDDLLSTYESPDDIRQWLIRTSFLGVEVNSGQFVHVEGETDARRQEKVAARFAAKEASDVRYRVHPAFRAYLEVRDDDLHNEGIRDVSSTTQLDG